MPMTDQTRMTHFIITLASKPDFLGRQAFTLEWKDPERGRRGQYGGGVLSKFTTKCCNEGKTFEIRDPHGFGSC